MWLDGRPLDGEPFLWASQFWKWIAEECPIFVRTAACDDAMDRICIFARQKDARATGKTFWIHFPRRQKSFPKVFSIFHAVKSRPPKFGRLTGFAESGPKKFYRHSAPPGVVPENKIENPRRGLSQIDFGHENSRVQTCKKFLRRRIHAVECRPKMWVREFTPSDVGSEFRDDLSR